VNALPSEAPSPRPRGKKRLADVRRADAADMQRVAKETGPPLLKGHRLRCPGCENVADILEYTPLQFSEKYADQIVVPLVCRRCRHTFALRPGMGDI
jgi:hypothetical protein